jgi:hypothetical protein
MKELIFFIVTIFLLGLTSSADFEYTIVGDKTLAKISLNSAELEEMDLPSSTKITNFIDNGETYLEFISPGFISKSGKNYFFIVSNELHKNSTIKVVLPEGAIIPSDYFIFPKDYAMSTNGQNIIVSWSAPSEKEILINYKGNDVNYWYFILPFVFIVTLFLYFKFYYKKKTFSKNLFREEKEIIDYLYKHGDSWTKELSKNLDISKVKLSRKLRSLEEKKLIKKEPHGNENRIRLLK